MPTKSRFLISYKHARRDEARASNFLKRVEGWNQLKQHNEQKKYVAPQQRSWAKYHPHQECKEIMGKSTHGERVCVCVREWEREKEDREVGGGGRRRGRSRNICGEIKFNKNKQCTFKASRSWLKQTCMVPEIQKGTFFRLKLGPFSLNKHDPSISINIPYSS